MKKMVVCAVIAGLFSGVASAKELTASEKDAAIAVPTIVVGGVIVTAPLWVPPLKKIYDNSYGVRKYGTIVNGSNPIESLKVGDIITNSGIGEHGKIFIIDKFITRYAPIGEIKEVEAIKLHALFGNKLVTEAMPERFAAYTTEIKLRGPCMGSSCDFFVKEMYTSTMDYERLNNSLKSGKYYKLEGINKDDLIKSWKQLPLEPYNYYLSNCQTCTYNAIKDAAEQGKQHIKAQEENLQNDFSAEKQEFQEELAQEQSARMEEKAVDGDSGAILNQGSNPNELKNADAELSKVATGNAINKTGTDLHENKTGERAATDEEVKKEDPNLAKDLEEGAEDVR